MTEDPYLDDVPLPVGPSDGDPYDEDTETSEPFRLRIVTDDSKGDHRPPGLLDRILTRTELATLPPADPLIDNTLDRRTFAVLAGMWGTGKSLLALDWACCVATGQPWTGRLVDTGADGEGNTVLLVAGEGTYGIHQRISAWESERGITVDRLHVLPTPVNLLSRQQVAEVCVFIYENNVDLVVVDTLSRCMAGADENAAKDMSTAVESLDAMRTARDDGGGTCVLAVHHTGKDRTTIRGSSVLEAAADTVYQVEGDGKGVQLSRTKRKDGPRDDEQTFEIAPVEVADSVVVRPVSADTGPVSKSDVLMSAFMSAFASTGATKADLRAVADMPPATFHRSLNTLVRMGLLVNTGTDKVPFYMAPRRDTVSA